MSAQVSSPEITFHAEHSGTTKRIWRTFWLLSALTIVELAIGLLIYNMHKGEHPNHTLVLAFKGMVCILTLAKAYYIVSVFMHLGDEVRNLIMTIVVPLCLFIWFIAAFLWDGNSWKVLRNRYNGTPAPIEKVTPAAKEKGAKD
ncbi:MAG: cytochrome C oxidase subunit IV family protein [Ferruginibacter sp.]|nr:cytochrome C oxidase subunit IV family protein [Ferruginibacter sp.]